ncbi:hypothetical protein FOZ63_024057, partial [Perkinsus olseni]
SVYQQSDLPFTKVHVDTTCPEQWCTQDVEASLLLHKDGSSTVAQMQHQRREIADCFSPDVQRARAPSPVHQIDPFVSETIRLQSVSEVPFDDTRQIRMGIDFGYFHAAERFPSAASSSPTEDTHVLGS